MKDKKIITEYSTHIRIMPIDKEYLKKNCKEEGMTSPANFNHYIIQKYKAGKLKLK